MGRALSHLQSTSIMPPQQIPILLSQVRAYLTLYMLKKGKCQPTYILVFLSFSKTIYKEHTFLRRGLFGDSLKMSYYESIELVA